MPTLGFLKKKRTKESPPGQKDLPSSQPTSPVTPTSSRPFENSIHSVSTHSSIPPSQTEPQPEPQSTAPPPSESAEPISEASPTAVGEQPDMAQSVAHHQQQHAYPPTEQQNLPSINNMINPPQHDGPSHSVPKPLGAPTDTQTKQTLQAQQPVVRQTKGKYSLGDFEILRTLGTGSFGRVHLVQSKHNQRFYAVKVLKKQQVVKMKQVEHTNDERKMLQEVKHPFLITLWGTFQDSKNLYMVMDFVEGGELFSLLRKSQVGHVPRCDHYLAHCLHRDFPIPWPSFMLLK